MLCHTSVRIRSFVAMGVALLGLVASAPAAELRLLSYNIHHGEGLDGRIDLERIAGFIREEKPDVVALQEVDRGCTRSHGVRQADELARLTGMQSFFARFMDHEGGEYGMALLTRLPILTRRRVELPAGREPRASAVVMVQCESGPVTFANIHFYQTATQRLAQAKALAEAVSDTTNPVVWVGDFNSHLGDDVMSWLAAEFAVPAKQGPTNTFPANQPREEIDYVIYRPNDAFTVKEYRVLDEQLISDHRPVRAVLVFAGSDKPAVAESDNFDQSSPGAPPAGWSSSVVGSGRPIWTVERDSSAPSAPQVLKQSAELPNASFPLCLKNDSAVRDGFVQTRFKAVSGTLDQAGGVVWRARDPDNYYVCRANALEHNVVLYKVENGQRQSLDIVGRQGGYGVKTKVSGGQWHALRVEFRGSRFNVVFDGKPLFEVEDQAFRDAGMVGVWTKADSVTLFDDFRWGAK